MSVFRQILISKKYHIGTTQVVPSSYSNSTFQSIDTPTNIYTDTNSTTRAQLLLPTGSIGTSYYAYFNFDFSEIPSNAHVKNVVVKVKTMASSTSNLQSVTYQVYKNNTPVGTLGSNLSTEVKVQTLEVGEWTREELNNMQLFIEGTRRNNSSYKNRTAYIYLYGIDVTVDYEYWA